ncbi:MAG: HEAT repeat domain-containing protein [Isosphaeraceae bacterium]
MLGATVLLVLACGQAPEGSADPGAMVARLGAHQYSEREAASRALERLGRPALPALRAARDSRDPEIRTRAAGLLHKIEGMLLTQPTRVRLDFDRAPLVQVTRSLSQQAGFKVALYPENLGKWNYTKVTLRRPEPVTFWKAVDLICDAAELQQSPGLHGIAGPREPTFALTNGPSGSITPNSDDGPFRVSLLGLHLQRDLTYGPSLPGVRGDAFGGNPGLPRAAAPGRRARMYVINEQFTASMALAAEPRLTVSQNGPLQVTEAVDDLGQSLIPPTEDPSGGSRLEGYFGSTSGSVLRLQVPLRRPATPGRTIKKLRGTIPLNVCSRRPDPLHVPLDRATGKKFANADVDLVVHSIRPGAIGAQTMLELSVKASERASSADQADVEAFGELYPVDTNRLQLEILDSRGQLVTWFPSGLDSETSRLTLTLNGQPGHLVLKELRYYTLTRATVSVPFEFRDVPMP